MSDEGPRERLHRSLKIEATEPTPSDEDYKNAALEDKELEDEQKKLTLESQRRDINARTRYVDRVYWLIVFWLIFVAVVIVQDARQPLFSLVRFDVSDPVLIALITTTTINVIGLFIVVLRYLFPRPEAPPQADTSQEVGTNQ